MMLYTKSQSFKIGYSLSKKHGKAVVRNRIKRLIRACYKDYIDKINGNYNIVILPKIAEEYEYSVFLKDLNYALKKGNIING